jgi:hypothetical protein
MTMDEYLGAAPGPFDFDEEDWVDIEDTAIRIERASSQASVDRVGTLDDDGQGCLSGEGVTASGEPLGEGADESSTVAIPFFRASDIIEDEDVEMEFGEIAAKYGFAAAEDAYGMVNWVGDALVGAEKVH